MAEIKKINTELQLLDKFLDTSGDAGTSGQVLTSTGTGINWVSGSGLPGGPYLPLAGGTMTGNTKHNDQVFSYWGNSDDLAIRHNGTDSWIENYTGDLQIVNYADDKDIRFWSDNGSGGVAEYFRVDGGITKTVFVRDTKHLDTKKALFGDQDDLQIYHDGSNSYISEIGTGDLRFIQNVDDGKIRFYNDNGSGGITEYLRIDGSSEETLFSKQIRVTDNIKISAGNSSDLQIYHDGSNSYITDTGTGDLYIRGSNSVYIGNNAGTKTYISGTDGGATKLYYNGAGAQQKLETTSAGAKVTGDLTITDDLNINGNELTFTNDAASSYIRAADALLIQSDYNTGEDKPIYLQPSAVTELTIATGISTFAGDVIVGDDLLVPKIRLEDINGTVGSLFKIYAWDDELQFTKRNLSTEAHIETLLALNYSTNAATFAGTLAAQGTGDSYFTGNVGIGTTSPSQKLHVAGSALINGTIYSGDGSISTSNSLQLQYNAVSGDGVIASKSTGGNTTLALQTSDSGATATKLYITSAGNVGIGTTSPGAKLDISDSIPTLRITGTRDASWTIGQTIASLEYFSKDSSGSAANSVRASINLVNETSVFGSTTGLAFSTKGDVSGAPSEAMRINASGNVGIGTTSPQFQLHVNSDSSGASAIGVGNTGSGMSRVYLDASNGDFSGSDYMWIGQNNDLTGEIFMAQNAGSFYIKTQPGGTSTVQLAVTQAGQVGIGTTSPEKKLDVRGDIQIHSGNISTSVQEVGFKNIYNTALLRASYTNPSQTTETYLAFHANTSGAGNGTVAEQMRIAGDKVGIGTTSPDRKLEVDFTSSVYGARFTRSDATGSSLIEFANSAGVKSIIGYDAGVDGYKIGTASATNIVVKQNGNVGIGTTTPGSELQVDQYTVGSNGTQNVFGNLSSFANSGSENLFLGIKNASYPDRGWAFNPINNGVNSNLQIKEHGSTAVRMTLESGGNVGIGTTNPASLLHLESASSPTLQIKDTTNNVTFKAYAQDSNSHLANISNHDLFIDTNNTSRIAIKAGGNVGIGTTSPNFKLTVAGDGYSQSSWGVGTAVTPVGKIRNNSGIFDIRAEGARQISLSNVTNGELIRINATGDVGIGTTTPTTKLHVTGITQIVESGNAAFYGGNYVRMFNDQNYNFRNSGGTTIANIAMSGDTYFNGGNVGIGTTSPSSKLHVYNGEAIIATSTDGLKLSYSVGNSSGIIDTAFSDNNLEFRTNGTTKMWIANAGNVGIGTTSPAAPLDVNGNIQITGGSNTLIFDNSTIKWQQYVNTNEFTLRYYNGSNWNERLRVDTDGNVGIGTTNPEAKLHVTDSIRIDTGGAGPSAAPTTGTPTQAQVRNGGDETYYLSEPDTWLTVNIGGTDYVIPAYEA